MMYDPFDRRVAFSAVALVFGKMKGDFDIWKKNRLVLDPLIRQNNLFKGMPFLWVGITYRYGIKNDLNLNYVRRIDKKYGDLCVDLELDMEILEWADRNNLDLLHDIFMIAALEALIQVGQKYKFPTVVLEEERAKYGNIPNTIEECQEYSKKLA